MSKIDRYLLHAFDTVKEEMHLKAKESNQPAPERVMLPMLLQVSDESWTTSILPDYQETSRLGKIIACLGSLRTLDALKEDKKVISIEASRRGSGFDCSRSIPFIKASRIHRLPEKGDKALIAIIDGGIDVLHEAFLDSTGTQTRVLAIWDQRDNTGPHPKTHTYGTEHNKADIDSYIQSRSVPIGLGRDSDGHGTHVASIAAGSPGTLFAGGVAPEAKIIVVIPRLQVGTTDPFSLGYSNSHVDALKYIKEFAESLDLPVVVNVSQGMNAGAHDGTSLLEAAFDEFSSGGREPGFVIVKSAGNERGYDGHAKLRMPSNGSDSLDWNSSMNHRGPDVIELWFKACDEMKFRLINPKGSTTNWVTWSNDYESGRFSTGNKYDISYVRYHHDNGDSRLVVTITAGSALSIQQGRWSLEIASNIVKSPGDIDAWMERDDDRPIRFTNNLNDDITVSIPGTANTVICVGAIEASMPVRVAGFSSYGPTRDGRNKPDLAAPGENVVAAEGNSASSTISKSGTSMAAPHVTGAIALLFSHWSKQSSRISDWKQLNAAQIRAAISQVTQNYNGRWYPGMGFGAIDAENLLSAFG